MKVGRLAVAEEIRHFAYGDAAFAQQLLGAFAQQLVAKLPERRPLLFGPGWTRIVTALGFVAPRWPAVMVAAVVSVPMMLFVTAGVNGALVVAHMAVVLVSMYLSFSFRPLLRSIGRDGSSASRSSRLDVPNPAASASSEES